MARYDVRRFMSARPIVTSRRCTLADAHQVMRERGIRHLPVVDGGRLVGVVSQRDLYMLETLRGIDAAAETVDEAMTQGEPYAVSPDAPLGEVARTMADRSTAAPWWWRGAQSSGCSRRPMRCARSRAS